MYNFKEFIAALNCKDFDVLEKKWLKFANKIIKDSVVAFKKGKHKGDCTKQPYLCDLCMYETMLSEFKEYSLHEEEYRIDNCL